MAEWPTPLPISTSPIVVPPDTTTMPPPWTVAPLSVPPAKTTTRPLLLTVVDVAEPPELTNRPPLLPAPPPLVLLTIVPTARLPDDTVSIPGY